MKFSKTLTDWYSVNKRDLPWRKTGDPYFIWLSEIILQQTQIGQGLPYYLDFKATFPTIFHLANATEDTVLKHWQGLGYYSRARNLHATAKYVAEHLNGVFPSNYEELIKLKGVGDYTASAIASICFDESCAVVDGNVYRLLSRYFGIDTPINSTQGIKYFKNLAQSLLPDQNIGDYNQAVMEFGSRQCKPKSPNCNACPLNTSCVAYAEQRIDKLPVKIKKTKIKKRYFNYLVFAANNNRTLLNQRQGKDIWQNLFEFPLVETKLPIGEKVLTNKPEFKELVGESKYSIHLFNTKEIVHKLSHQHLFTKFWIAEVDTLKSQGILWSEIENFPVPILIKNFIDSFNFVPQD